MVTSTWTEASIWMVVMLLTTSIGLNINSFNKIIRNKINHSLVNSHFKMIPGVGTFTARGLTGGDTENLGGHTDGTGHLDLLINGNTLNISASYEINQNERFLLFSTALTLVETRVIRIR